MTTDTSEKGLETIIEKHLLSDETDPFNRSRLTKEMLIP